MNGARPFKDNYLHLHEYFRFISHIFSYSNIVMITGSCFWYQPLITVLLSMWHARRFHLIYSKKWINNDYIIDCSRAFHFIMSCPFDRTNSSHDVINLVRLAVTRADNRRIKSSKMKTMRKCGICLPHVYQI